MRKRKIVVIIESSRSYREQFKREIDKVLGSRVEVLFVSNLSGAKNICQDIIASKISPDIVAIEPALVSGEEVDLEVVNIVSLIKNSVNCLVIATSVFDEHNTALLRSGADYKCYKTKTVEEVVGIINPGNTKKIGKIVDVELSKHALNFVYACLSGFNEHSRGFFEKIKSISKKSDNLKLRKAVEFIEDQWRVGEEIEIFSRQYNLLVTAMRDKLFQAIENG